MRLDRDAVVVVGAGTLGSVLTELLVREWLDPGAGWGQRLFLIDFDTVQGHNAAKSAIFCHEDIGREKVFVAGEWAARVNPSLRVIPLPCSVEDAGLGPFLHAGAVFICVDTLSGKLAASRQAWRAGVPLMMFGELAGGGRLDSRYRWFSPRPTCPCLECGWLEEYAHLEHAFPCTPASDRPGPATRLTVAARTAASMLDEARRLLANRGVAENANEVRIAPELRQYRVFRPRCNPRCAFDHQILDHDAIQQLRLEADQLMLHEAFAHAIELRQDVASLAFTRPVALGFTCPGGHEWPRLQRLSASVPTCPTCGAFGSATQLTFDVSREIAGLHHRTTLASLVPPGDVLTFDCNQGAVDDSATVRLALAPPGAWSVSGEPCRSRGQG